MSTLTWTDNLALGLPVMDDTHREFVGLLTKVVTATDMSLLSLWRELITHTDTHFAREDQWMKDTGFASTNCHTTQHQVVLQVMREGDKHGNAGDLAIVRQMADELGIWFPQHAQSMDAALALHLRGVGYDKSTGQVNMPEAAPTEKIEGCHSTLCTSHDAQADKLAYV
jgi:hemerythrin-like metal-binding protein